MNSDWKYVPFSDLFQWTEKSSIKSGDGKMVGKYKMFVCSDTEIKRFDEYLENKPSLVFGTGGKASCHIVCEPFAYSTDCVVAQPKSDQTVLKFYYYYLRKDRLGELQKTFTGSGLQHSSKRKIDKIVVPILAYDEQVRIVARIEELFSQLDDGVKTLLKTKEQLEVYRQAVLKEAFLNCKEHVSLESVTQFITDGDHMPPPKADAGVPFIMISNVKDNLIRWENTAYVRRDYYDGLDYKRKPQNGDVLYTVTGSYGIPILVDYDKEFCFQRHIALLRPNDSIEQKHLYYSLMTPEVYAQATKGATGTAQKTVGLGVLRKIKIPYNNDRSEQIRIVERIERGLSVCDSIKQAVNTAIQQAEAMRQSILKKAFEGHL